MGGEGIHGEDDADGCPGGWYRTPFYLSFAKYRRGKHDSLYLRDCRDPLVYEAVAYYEGELARRSDWT